MRTTVDLPDETFRELKALAVRRRTTLKELLIRAAERELSLADTNKHRTQLPLVHSSKPGTLHLTNTEIDDLLA